MVMDLQKNLSWNCCPDNKTLITLEKTNNENFDIIKALWCNDYGMPNDAVYILEKIIGDLILVNKSQITD